MSQSSHAAGRRLSVITVDQAIAGASNVLVAVLAARVLGIASFGLFGIVFLVYVVAQGVSRALVCDPLLVHSREAEDRRGEVIGTSCLLGVALGALILVAALVARVWSTQLGDALVVLAVCLPLLMLQDLGRYLGFALQRPSASVVLDTCWLVLAIAAVVVLLVSDARTLAWFIIAWGGSGAVTGLLLFWQHRGVRVRITLSWLRHTWMFSWRYLVSYTSTQGSALAGSSAVGAIAGAKALGGVQGSVLLVRPFGTFQIAAVAAGVAEINRSFAGDVRRVRRHGSRTSALTAGIALVNAAIILALPDRIGEVVLGPTWHAAKPLLLPTAVQIMCLGVITGARAGLLGMRRVRWTMGIDVTTTALVLVATVCGAYVNGALGALWAVSLGQALMALVWWVVFWSHTAAPAAAGPGSDHAAVPLPVTSTPPAA